jgi:DNA polymerase I-like protein with 3'-5' exonuclease and polymerase domains
MQGLLFPTESSWKPVASINDLPRWAPARRIALDHEMRDDTLDELGPGWNRGGYICGFGFMLEGDRPYYLPIRHAGGGNMNVEEVIRYCEGEAPTFEGECLGANRIFDMLYESVEGIRFVRAKCQKNILVADALINEWHHRYSLEAACQRWDVPGKNEEKLKQAAKDHGVHPKKELHKLHSKYVGEYGEQDCAALFPLADKLEAKIAELGLTNVWENIEVPWTQFSYEMTEIGMRVSEIRLRQLHEWCRGEQQRALKRFHQLTGYELRAKDIMKAEACAAGLERIGIIARKTVKLIAGPEGDEEVEGAASVDQTWLANLKHPAADALIWARKMEKLDGTYITPTQNHLVKGRLHATYNQIAADDGEGGGVKGVRGARTSANHTNVQNQPTRDELLFPWRAIFLADGEDDSLFPIYEHYSLDDCMDAHVGEPAYPHDDDFGYAECDFSQQEWRLLVDWCDRLELTGAKQLRDEYNTNPKLDVHKYMAKLTGLPRPHAKNCGFAIIYGAGGVKICVYFLKLPTRWAAYAKGKVLFYADTKDEMYKKLDVLQDPNADAREVAGEEGQSIIDTYLAKAPFIDAINKKAQETAKKRGYLLLRSGRRINFPRDFKTGRRTFIHAALNRLVQNSAADLSKMACNRIRAELGPRIAQCFVHDSVGGSMTLRQARIMQEIMRDTDPELLVKNKVDLKFGRSWGEAEKV